LTWLLVGRGFLEEYDHSLAKIVREAYPNHDWQAWRFIKLGKDETAAEGLPTEPFEKPPRAAIQSFLNSLSAKIRAKPSNSNDLGYWYSVNIHHQGITTADRVALSRLGGLPSALKEAYPSHPWNFNNFTQGSSRNRVLNQSELSNIVHEVLPP